MRQRLQPITRARPRRGSWRRSSSACGPAAVLPLRLGRRAPGGSPEGACWVGPDSYAMCTPSLAIDLVIESGEDAVVLVRRGDNGKFATMGGFVDVGEAPRDAVARELKEETNLDLASPPSLLGVFGDLGGAARRRHTVSAVTWRGRPARLGRAPTPGPSSSSPSRTSPASTSPSTTGPSSTTTWSGDDTSSRGTRLVKLPGRIERPEGPTSSPTSEARPSRASPSSTNEPKSCPSGSRSRRPWRT